MPIMPTIWHGLKRAGWNYSVLWASYRDWEDHSGVFLPVKRCTVEYLRPAAFDDQIQVETTMTRLTRASVYFHYRVLRGEDVLAVGTSEHPFVNKEGRIVRMADKLLPQFFS
jgi:acyl-CoA thioester hydrolase